MIDPSRVDWTVYAIIDPRFVPASSSLEEVAQAALEGGAGVVQLRDKAATTADLVAAARRLRELCEAHGAAFVVNDRVDVALAAGAHGVHLGPEDMAIGDARRIAPDLLVGGSAGTAERARELVAEGAHYLGSGAVFDASGSKPDAVHNRGVEALAAVVEAVDVPVVGIGGIDRSNVARVAPTGAAGVAVIRAICAADEPRAATQELYARFSQAR